MIIFENSVPTLTIALCLGGAVLAAAYSAFRYLPSGAFRIVLFGLHVLALLGLGWCLFMPGLKTTITQLLKPRFLVVVDTSRSMNLKTSDSAPSRWETARKALDMGWTKKLSSECNIDVYSFDGSLSEGMSLGAAEDLKPEGASTSLREALTKIEQRLAGLPIEGMVLLSDGTDTVELTNDWASAPRPFPIHTLQPEKPGGWEQEADLRIDGVTAARRVTVGWKTEIKVKVSGQGTKGAPVSIQLFEDDRLVAEKPTQIPDAGGEREVVFDVERPKVGVFNTRIVAVPLAGEKNKEDNEWTGIIEVVDARNRVLYVEGVPRWEYKYLRRVLMENRQISPVIFFTGGDGKPQAATPAESITADMNETQLSALKVVVLGNLDAAELGQDRAKRLLNFVEKGGSLVVLGGTKAWTPGGLTSTELAKALPIEGGRPTLLESEKPLPVKLTPQAATHPAFAGDAKFWKSIPPVLSVFTGLQAKPAAESLVTVDTPGGSVPLVLTQRFGEGKVAVILTDSLWRWQLGPESGDAKPYKRFWTQLVSWLLPKAENLNADSLELFTDRDDLFLGEKITINARLGDDKAKDKKPASIDATLVYPDGRSIPYRMDLRQVSTASGDSFEGYSVEFKGDTPGAYRVTATAKLDGKTVTSKPMSFFVKPFSPETSPRPANFEVLQAISSASGGSYFETPEALNSAMMNFNLKAKEESFSEFQTLWRNWPAVVIVMLLFAATWFARRTRQMP